jgi:phage terminase Nu1 subunit (DNA packaging protein)
MSGKLKNYLADFDVEAEEMFSRLVKQMAEKREITERLKVTDQMRWVQEMNNVRNTAAEIVYTELIYS